MLPNNLNDVSIRRWGIKIVLYTTLKLVSAVIKVSVGLRVGIVTLSYGECFRPENLAQTCQMITKIWFAED